MKKYTLIAFLLVCIQINTLSKEKDHPCLYIKDSERQSVLDKIKQEEWAANIWADIKSEIDGYVNVHTQDPEWIISRLAMYWKEGERYTQCFLKQERWDYGEGDAPVPTLRLPGMRTWNDYNNVPLHDRIPYNVTGDMRAISRSNPSTPVIVVPYKESGHLIRNNNKEILSLAEKAAFAYWLTKDTQYAKFAADIYWKCLFGIYYMRPPLDPGKSSKGSGGYAPGGIIGYYDYEQIHDDMQLYIASIYDLMFDYLKENTDPHLKKTGKTFPQITSEVLKRFVEIGLVRGGKTGNWNVNGFDMIMRSILVLERNEYYEDKKGLEYYLPFFTTHTTQYHEALPDILKVFNPNTGLWPEAPGYASPIIATLLNMALPIYKNTEDVISNQPMIQKAALANIEWLDPRGNLVVFGDMRGGSLDYNIYERLLTYYSLRNDSANIRRMSATINQGIVSGQYNRGKGSWISLCLNKSLSSNQSDQPYKKAVYSAEHRHLIMRNGNDTLNGMMFTLYGGEKGKHLSENGLALQFYAKGWALALDASAYESYWSNDFQYHQKATGANTIIPGYVAGPIKINATEPYVNDTLFTTIQSISSNCSFADISASEKRRLVGMVRTSKNTGYYVDIFRSDLVDNDYIYHNLGNEVKLYDTNGSLFNLNHTNHLKTAYTTDGYNYFSNVRSVSFADNFYAEWNIHETAPYLNMRMWMLGQKNRELFIVDAPPTTLLNSVTPMGVNKSPQKTPTIIVRQKDCNAASNPFVAIFEPFSGEKGTVKHVTKLLQNNNAIFFKVAGDGITQTVCNAIDDNEYRVDTGLEFSGIFGIYSQRSEKFDYMYLGRGKVLGDKQIKLEAISGYVSAELILENGEFLYSSDAPIRITIMGKTKEYPPGFNLKLYNH